MLERLSPPERAVLVLREALELSHREIADILVVGQASSRQLLARARRHLADARARVPAAFFAVVLRFVAAVRRFVVCVVAMPWG
jgi:RNA polymerase sigma-70 factor (ECF subfamily)